jgi:uncharacterized protein YndB with AHSA1/START domain
MINDIKIAPPETAPTEAAPFLEIRRTFKAPRARVFDAWTKPELIRQWFGPKGMTCPEATLDLRPGGAYRICIVDNEGEEHVAIGTFSEVRPPERLGLIWHWEEGGPGVPGHQTQVTIDFFERGDATEMLFRHVGFETTESRDRHIGGWTTMFERLADFITH